MIDPLDYDRSIMELQLKKQKLREEIAEINDVISWLKSEKERFVSEQDDMTTDIFKDILGDN